MLGAQFCVRTVPTYSIFLDQYNAASAYPTTSSLPRSSTFHSSVPLHFTTKYRPPPKPLLISSRSAHCSFGPQYSNGDNQDHHFLQASLLVSDTIRIGYGMGRVRDTKSTYDVSLDSAADSPDLLSEELDSVRNMDLAVKEESNVKRQINEYVTQVMASNLYVTKASTVV